MTCSDPTRTLPAPAAKASAGATPEPSLSTFIEIILGFPTVLFTVPLAFAMFYWVLAIVGAVDLDVFDGLDGLDGALDSLDGAADGALEGMTDAAVEGVADAVADAAVEGAAEGAAEAEPTAAGLGGPLVLLFNVLRIGKVPVTVSLTMFCLWGWVTGFLLTWIYRNVYGIGVIPHVAFSLAAMVVAVVFALGITNVAVRPLEPVFKSAPGRKRNSIIGETAQLTTGRVDADFGQATVQIKGDDLVFQVRCDRKGNGLRRGDFVLVVHYDNRREAYVVEPLTTVKVESTGTLRSALDLGGAVPSTRSMSEPSSSRSVGPSSAQPIKEA